MSITSPGRVRTRDTGRSPRCTSRPLEPFERADRRAQPGAAEQEPAVRAHLRAHIESVHRNGLWVGVHAEEGSRVHLPGRLRARSTSYRSPMSDGTVAGRRLLTRRRLPNGRTQSRRGARRPPTTPSTPATSTRSRISTANRPRPAAASADVSLPFGGVPIGVKELDSVAGWPDTHACVVYRDQVATHTSTNVARARDLGGAVLVGQTTASEFGGVNLTRTVLNGTTHNPWQYGQDARRLVGWHRGRGGRRPRHARYRWRRRRLDPHPGRLHQPRRASRPPTAGSRSPRTRASGR